QRAGDLRRDHVDLVVERDSDDHVAVTRAGLLEDVRVGAVADVGAGIERVVDLLDEVRPQVDERDVVAFGGEPLGNAEADLAGAADEYLHGERSPGADALDSRTALQPGRVNDNGTL